METRPHIVESGDGSEVRPLGMDDLPSLGGWTLRQLEEHVAGKFLTKELSCYLGNAWRNVSRGEAFSPDDPCSACAGFISLEPPPQAAIDLGRKLAKKYGW